VSPLFPLSNVVLFSNAFLPLFVFEDRYRAMVRDALAGDRVIEMVLLRSELEQDVPVPPIYDVGCSGLITRMEPASEGRSNIVLRGLELFRILAEDHSTPYRQATVESLPKPTLDDDVPRSHRKRLEALLDRRLSAKGSETWMPSQMADSDLVNALFQYLKLNPVEKQALLERDGTMERCQSLIDLLEMDALTDGRGFSQTTVQ
jgi:Lon protease-like protein